LANDRFVGAVPRSEVGALASGEMLVREFAGRKVLLCRVEGSLYALENRCSHALVELSQGWIDGYAIECPFHGARFDVRSGDVLSPPAREPIEAFDVVESDAGVEIRSRRSAQRS
jgi:nitrite reductase/ring-hydroxylating ferredoxin subunit